MSSHPVNLVQLNTPIIEEIVSNLVLEVEYEARYRCFTAGLFNANLADDNKFISSNAPTRFRFARDIDETNREIHYENDIFNFYLTVEFDPEDRNIQYLQLRAVKKYTNNKEKCIFRARMKREKDKDAIFKDTIFRVTPYLRTYRDKYKNDYTLVSTVPNMGEERLDLSTEKMCFYMSIFKYTDNKILGSVYYSYLMDVMYGRVPCKKKYNLHQDFDCYEKIFNKKSSFSGSLFKEKMLCYSINDKETDFRDWHKISITVDPTTNIVSANDDWHSDTGLPIMEY